MNLCLKGKRSIVLGALVFGASVTGFSWVLIQQEVSKHQPQVAFDAQVWRVANIHKPVPSHRQRMIKDLVTNVLPGKTKDQIEQLLGKSRTHNEMRYTEEYVKLLQGVPDSKVNTNRYAFDDLGWDLTYPIGNDPMSDENSPNGEYLLIRLDSNGRFESWFITGSKVWPRVVGKKGRTTYRKTRGKESSKNPSHSSAFRSADCCIPHLPS
jgi:hypothetical protein